MDCTNEPAAELAAKLAQLAPGTLNHVAYSVSGSCANDTAVRLAHYYHSRRGEPDRRVILSRYNSYHGSTYLGMTLGNREGDRSPHFRYIEGLVHHLGAPYAYRRPEGMSEAQFTDHLVAELQGAIRDIGAREHRRLHRRANPGSGGRRAAAGRVPAAHAGVAGEARNSLHLGRGSDGVRPHRALVCLVR